MGKKLVFPDMWLLYKIQILVSIKKFCWSAATLIIYILSMTAFTLEELSSCYRNCLWCSYHVTFLLGVCYKMGDVDVTRRHLECWYLCITIFYYFCYQFIPIVLKVHFEWCAFKAHWSKDYLIKLMVKCCLSCNETITVLKKKIQYMLT